MTDEAGALTEAQRKAMVGPANEARKRNAAWRTVQKMIDDLGLPGDELEALGRALLDAARDRA